MKKSYYFGIDVGGTFTKVVLVDEKGRVRARAQVSSEDFSQKTNFVSVLRNTVWLLSKDSGVASRSIRGMGIGVPGPVDFERGVILSLTNIRGWDHFHLPDYLEGKFPFPAFVENDANCMALAESRLGAAKGACFALCLTLGTGVGGGMILNREIYRGSYFFGGEVGHIPLSIDGPRCPCGGSGCLERFVGNQAILARVKKVFGKSLPLEEVSLLARRADPRAKKVWAETAEYLGLAIAGLVNVFGPEVVVIGGGVAGAGAALMRPLNAAVRKYAMNHLKSRVRIVLAALGNDAGMLGAALLAKEKTGCV